MTNLLNLIINIKKNGNYNLSNILTIPKGKASSLNRANDMGTALEFFMKDSICNTFNVKDIQKKKDAYSENFSYFGTQNHPPDLIIKNGDAMEVKKKDGVGNSELQLNSSYPKSKIFSSSSLITQACKDCESGWIEKDMIYAIGFVDDNDLKLLTLVYGDCYAASPEIYETVRNKVINGIGESIEDSADTNELGRLNGIDPLKITNMRIRGMWTIQNPLSVFSDIFGYKKGESKFTLIALMRKKKYASFQEKYKKEIENDKSIKVGNVKIQEPDNPAKQTEVVLIKFDVK